MKELVLLVEPDQPNTQKLRPFQLARPFINEIIERCKLGEGHEWIRTWRCTNGERALSGQRIFREVLPVVKEEPEKPLYDELVIKQPLKFGVDGKTFKQLAKKYGKR